MTLAERGVEPVGPKGPEERAYRAPRRMLLHRISRVERQFHA